MNVNNYQVSDEMIEAIKKSLGEDVPAAGPEAEDLREDDNQSKKPSASEILIGIMGKHVKMVFTNEVGECFAVFTINGIRQVHSVRSSIFKSFLIGLYFRETGKGLPSEALKQVIGIAEAQALFSGAKKKTFLRVGKKGETVIFDLANEKWQSVFITADGWEVKQSPVGAIRAANTAAQVVPERGGTIKLLRQFLNVKNERDFILTAVWLAYCISSHNLPKPIICLHGSKGAGKSTFQRVLRRLMDPTAAELTHLPSTDEQFALLCEKNYLLNFDNLSRISQAQSDFLCTVATGGALSKRRLYTDNEEVIYRFCRPVTLSGINAVAEKSDLLDRCIMIELERIVNRQSERKFWKEFESVRGKILGALFDAVAYSLRTEDLSFNETIRMIDFQELGYKLAIGLGFDGEEFLAALRGNSEKTVDTALKTSPVAVAVCELIESEGSFDGSASELHRKLEAVACRLRLGRVFPKSAAALSRQIKTLKTDLRAAGIEIEEYRIRHKNLTCYVITKDIEKMSSHSSHSSQASNGAGSGREDIAKTHAKRLFEMSSRYEPSNGAGCEACEDSEDIFGVNLLEGEI